MFVQMVQHKQRPFVAEFVNHVPNRTVQVLRIYLPLQFSHFPISLFIYLIRNKTYKTPLPFAKCAAKLQKFPKVTKYFSEIRSKKVTLSSFFAFLGAKKINGGFLSRTLPSYMCQNLVLAVSTRVCSEVLCVASNTRSAIRSTSSPAQIEICGVPHWKRSER